MTTKQNDAATMTEEQLDAVSGGPHIRNFNGFRLIYRNRSASLVSAEPLPSPSPRMGLRGNYVGVVNEPGPVW